MNVSEPRITSSPSTRHREPFDVRRGEVELGGADQGDAKRAEGVAQGRSLGNGGHLHHAQPVADDRAHDQPGRDSPVIKDFMVKKSSDDRQQHAQLAGPDAAASGRRRAHPLEREDEEPRGDQVGDLDDVFAADHGGQGFLGPLDLNILSIRSVITNPPTTLLVAAMIATVPSSVVKCCAAIRPG